MRIGQYVRCPVIREEKDELFPRIFILGQIAWINDLSGEVNVTFHDLLNRARFYADIFKKKTFPLGKVRHCRAAIDSPVITPDGVGKIVSRKHESADASWEYHVMLQNGEVIPYFEEELKIDTSAADYPPAEQMKQYEFQNPTWYASRIHVSKNVHMINNSVYGFKELVGCRTFLMAHQITTIVRAFESRPIRYMLADEVGLGKTIEAASIIKILSSEKRELRVLYIVPRALVHQWANELKYKFGIRASIGDAKAEYASHLIVALENFDINSEAFKENWDFLLVDETHRLLSQEDKYGIILQLSKNIENVLLLSATPIQDRKEEYLKLLSLLNPEHYCRLTLNDFESILKKQNKIQHRVNSMIFHMDKFDYWKEDIYEKLDSLAEELDDGHLREIISKTGSNDETDSKTIAGLAIAYISENYRVARNVIRNRRAFVHETLAIRKILEIPYEVKNSDDGYQERNIYNAILDYLSQKISEDAIKTKDIILILQAMFSSPWALEECVINLKIDDSDLLKDINHWVLQAEDELNQTDYFLNDAPDEIKSRLLHVVDFIESEVRVTNDNNGKVVIFSEFPQTLWKLGEVLAKRHIQSVIFTANMQQSELEDSVFKFQNNKDCRILLCDETGGEGRNFQNADWLIHVDLPWNANAIEQRIGRLDRLGRDQNHLEINSVVFYGIDTIEAQLFRIWNEGLNLFQESICGLEIITAELNKTIANAIRDDVYNGLENALSEIKELTEDARDAVEEEQLYDSATIIYKPMSDAVKHMLSAYSLGESDPFRSSMLGWANQVGLKSKPFKLGIEQFSASNFSVRAAEQSFYMPPDWELYRNTPINRREGKILGTFDRSLAIKSEDLIFYAPGDPVFDSIISNAINSERGRCTAFKSVAQFNYSGFACIYNVEPKISYLHDRNLPIQLLLQFRMYLPIEQIIVYVPFPFSNNDNISEEDLTQYIFNKRNIINAVHLGRRSGWKNGVSSLDKFMAEYPEDEWEETIERVKKIAYNKANEKTNELSDLKSARKEIDRIVDEYESQYIYIGKDMKTLQEIKERYEAVYYALSHPVFSLDSIALMFLTKR